MTDLKQDFSRIPSVNRLLENLQAAFPRIKTTYLKRFVLDLLDEVRSHPQRFALQNSTKPELENRLLELLTERVRQIEAGSLKKSINATGVVLHTGLGRAPIHPDVIEDLKQVSRYANLEIELESGRRGERTDHLAPLLRVLTGAEDGLAVNNNAAAVMLMLNSVAKRKEVIISRGEMIEIGGSFRLPEVMKASGCKLKEIGATNKTHLRDYEEAISEKTGAILICNPSNYHISGFTHKPELDELVELAHRHNLPLLYDLGSGALYDTLNGGEEGEPLVEEVVAAGVDLISFSGDKLLGGPQAGLIVGRKKWVQKCAKNHLLRTLRLDKFIIKLLQSTLKQYLFADPPIQKLAAIEALAASVDSLKERCEDFIARLPESLRKQCRIVETSGKVGSGAYPVLALKTRAIRIQPSKGSAAALAKRLRLYKTPVFTYVDNDCVHIDLRTVSREEETVLQAALTICLNE
ncbi:MAG TPA: L-seryl-tRNA(Sec) selenium transferase [Caldithrix abyssi]|uniref:L-seryl-tRNA(Sec) selenium transferase n=1 Tax=Caldithrix abyssi TaxID=187145 RepID=A0A7V4WUU7_CALAY|nr:L-seryl-tRNA(Sec) selenium transferase [Caldithrix abyssi]